MIDSTQTNESNKIERRALNIWLLIIYSIPFAASVNGKNTEAANNNRPESISLPDKLISKPKRINKTNKTKSPVFKVFNIFSINQKLNRANSLEILTQ
jgi:hypothetical protein